MTTTTETFEIVHSNFHRRVTITTHAKLDDALDDCDAIAMRHVNDCCCGGPHVERINRDGSRTVLDTTGTDEMDIG